MEALALLTTLAIHGFLSRNARYQLQSSQPAYQRRVRQKQDQKAQSNAEPSLCRLFLTALFEFVGKNRKDRRRQKQGKPDNKMKVWIHTPSPLLHGNSCASGVSLTLFEITATNPETLCASGFANLQPLSSLLVFYVSYVIHKILFCRVSFLNFCL